ncbi:MAG: hypothetical protein ACRCSK_06130 [Fusobacteriaceae bacterium]
MEKILKGNFVKEKFLAILIGTSILFPFVFHLAGINGKKFLPIYLSLTIGTLFLDKKYLTIIAILSPLLNMLIFKMPTSIIAYSLIFEGLVFVWLPIKNIFWRLVVARISPVILTFFIANYAIEMVKLSFLDGIIGIIINGAIVLFLKKFLDKRA